MIDVTGTEQCNPEASGHSQCVCVSCTVAQVIRFVSLGTCKVILRQDIVFTSPSCKNCDRATILTLLLGAGVAAVWLAEHRSLAGGAGSSAEEVVEGKGGKDLKGQAKGKGNHQHKC